jgi:flagellar biogenesis protein FliO
MLRSSNPLWTTLGFAGALAIPSLAQAGEVSVTLVEDPGGVTVRIRGVDPDASADHIVTSKTGALLFVPGDEATPQRLRPLERHRLDFVQIGRAGSRVAVRVVQRKRAKGTLSKSMKTSPVAGGFDVRIEDNLVPTVIATTTTPAFDRGAALSRIVGDPVPLPATATTTTPPPPAVTAVPALPQAAAVGTATTAASVPTTPAQAPFADAVAPPNEAVDDNPRWAAAATQQAPIDLARSAPQIGLAWLATAMLAFSGLGLLWWRRRRPVLETPQPLRVLARVGIGPKQQIVWISAGGRSLLVGATEQRIDLLADLSAPGAAAVPVEMPAAAVAAAPTPAPDGRIAAFKQRLRVALGDELSGRNEEPALPPHLEMLTGDPRWVGRKESA